MPSSKGKKHSKTQSRLSNSNNFSSPGSLDSEATEESFASSLELASVKFPSLIGNSAFIGRVTDVQENHKSCKIWLSEPSMVASSFTPGSIVSVSLPCLKSRCSDGFPLSSLADECARRFGVDSCGQLTNGAGNYFALATIFPSSKVTKNGVLLSSDISNTMGCPPSGRVIFIHSVQSQSQAGLLCDTRKARSTGVNCLSVYDCKELVLKLIMNSTSANSSEKSCRCSENGMLASPKTPLNQSKLSVFETNPVTSPRRGESVGNVTIPNESSVYSFDIEGVLGDDSAESILQTCARGWLYSRCLLIGNFVIIPVLSQLCLFRVIGAKNANHDLLNEASELVGGENDGFLVKRETKACFHLPSNPASETPQRINLSTGDDISRLGGLSKEYAALKDFIISSSSNSLLRYFRPKRGVILHGPRGTGKTSLAQLCARDSGFKVFSVDVPISEQDLFEVFDSARRAAPSVVFIDRIDAIAPARKDGGEELSEKIVVTLMTLMDGISGTDGVVVIATANTLDNIDPALRRAGRFNKEIEIGVPSPDQRLEILHVLRGAMELSLSKEQVQDLANATHGFVGADLVALCIVALRNFRRRHVKFKYSKDTTDVSRDYSDSTSSSVSHSKGTNANGDNFLNGLEEECVFKVPYEEFEKARMTVRPSAMREVQLEIPKVNWEDVGGQTEVKNQLKQAVIWPVQHRDALKRIGTEPPTGVLLCGPPGCSKTLLARAVASEAQVNFLAVRGPELLSKWVGESEKAVKSLFAKARANAPAIIFFDEIDGLAGIRGEESVSVSDRVISQLLVELDGLYARVDVTVIAATNKPEKIDSALLRPGRFDRLLHVRPPDEPDREEIFHIHLRKIPCSSDVNIHDLARLSEGCTGAHISLICQQATDAALEENLDASEVKMQHFKTAIKQVKPKEIQLYQELSENFLGCVASSAKKSKPFLSILLHIFVTCLLSWWICCKSTCSRTC